MPNRARTMVLSTVLALAGTAEGHHSHAMFDHSRTITVTGTVSDVSYRNPHVFIWIDAEDESGQVQNWSVEMSNIQNMIRRGIRASTFQVGDVVTVTMNPLQDGRLGGNYVTVIAADGTEYD